MQNKEKSVGWDVSYKLLSNAEKEKKRRLGSKLQISK